MRGDAYFLRACLNVSLPGLERQGAQALVDAAHQTRPYSKATRGDIDVTLNLVQAGLVTEMARPSRLWRPREAEMRLNGSPSAQILNCRL
jgi:hypothetical protein